MFGSSDLITFFWTNPFLACRIWLDFWKKMQNHRMPPKGSCNLHLCVRRLSMQDTSVTLFMFYLKVILSPLVYCLLSFILYWHSRGDLNVCLKKMMSCLLSRLVGRLHILGSSPNLPKCILRFSPCPLWHYCMSLTLRILWGDALIIFDQHHILHSVYRAEWITCYS